MPREEGYNNGAPHNITSLCYRQAIGDYSIYLEEQAIFSDGTLLLNRNGETYSLSNGDSFRDVACGRTASAAITQQGKVYVWGDRSKKLVRLNCTVRLSEIEWLTKLRTSLLSDACRTNDSSFVGRFR